ncbi:MULTISPECIES: hypothetical protein [unclassified Allomuricauda]|uniref:hypothetical protein n=1 Tax=unclassified Allomuricauda TaxID=2615049 RepID=UPI00273EE258|nr:MULTISPECIES: hypothetical protein [unclassified Allomuricauda]
MSKSAKTYTLLGLVLLIWGIIGFKVIKALTHEPDIPPMQVTKSELVQIANTKDSFSINADYRDPFLGTLPGTKKKMAQRTIKKEPVQKRNIIYSGLVTESSTGNTLFFISIDGQQHMMSLKEEINGVTLVNGNDRQIKVRYGGQSETISLQ